MCEQQMYTLGYLHWTDSPWLVQRKNFTPASQPMYEKLILLASWTIVYTKGCSVVQCKFVVVHGKYYALTVAGLTFLLSYVP